MNVFKALLWSGIFVGCHLLPTVAGVVYQAESAHLFRANVASQHAGFGGSGFVDYTGVGSFVEFQAVDVLEDGVTTIAIRYASPNGRPLELQVDGVKVGDFPCASTGAWTRWSTEEMEVTLSQGRHIIKVLARQSAGPNVDWISVEQVGQGSPTSSPPGSLIVYEAETAATNSVKIVSIHAGFQGSGYGDYQAQNAYLMWTVNAPVSGNYEVSVRYAARNGRPVEFEVDGETVGTFNMLATGAWSNWRTETTTQFLEAGEHSVQLTAMTNPGPNVDYLSLLLDCEGDCGSVPTPANPPPTAPQPVVAPTSRPVQPPAPARTDFPSAVVLASNSRLDRGDFVFSPNGEYKVGLTNGGNFVLQDRSSQTIWSSETTTGFRVFMQTDGNVIVRQSNNNAVWTTRTNMNRGATLEVDDGGRIAVMFGDVPKWLAGIPRGTYTGPSSSDIQFPVRGVFYYPWYPETWRVNGQLAHFISSLGQYSSSDPAIAENHVDAFDYANVDLSIASWFGPDTNLDRARILMLMDTTIEMQSTVKWSVYHEDERELRPNAFQIREDLDYLLKEFAWHPAWAHKDGKPVIFVFNEVGCEVAERWMDASRGDWYVVLKLFKDFTKCSRQPDSWHQYGVADGTIENEGWSYTIAPGFWRADRATPAVPRVSKNTFCDYTKGMVESGQPWQLIVSFNEAGEGTMIESSPSWGSSSGYGDYLDCLHQYVS